MVIYVVQEGDTASSIAQKHGVSTERLILDNMIDNPDSLVVGDSLVILYPELTYTVKEGDSLEEIASYFGITGMDLLRNNPYLNTVEYVNPGETLIISHQDKKIRMIAVIGYAYPYIDRSTLRETLPYLTYLAMYNYLVTEEGKLIDIEDAEVIRIAKEYGVAPLMIVSAQDPKGSRETNAMHHILNNEALQYRLLNNILEILKSKGYYGMILDTPYIFPEDRALYMKMLNNITARLNREGFVVFSSIDANAFEILTGIRYPGIDYSSVSQSVNGMILLTYEMGNMISVPTGAIAYHTIDDIISEAVMKVPPEQTFLGISNIGYIWEFPYQEGITKGLAFSHDRILELAEENGIPIQYDKRTRSAYLWYLSQNEYFIRFKDAKSIYDYLMLVVKYNLRGIAVWNIMNFFPEAWLILNSQFEIEKVKL